MEKLPGGKGDKVNFSEVLLVGGDAPKIGQPLVQGAAVAAEITAQDRGKKLVVFKFRRRKNYRRKNGHRQPYTEPQDHRHHRPERRPPWLTKKAAAPSGTAATLPRRSAAS